MVNYRRALCPGGTFFFTVTLRDRSSDLLVTAIDDLREAVRGVQQRRPFVINAMVVLPDHLHAIWTLPANDTDYARRWLEIKAAFSRRVNAHTPLRRNARGEFQLWQSRYWEHLIRDEADFAAHMDYVHINPFKHGLVSRPATWPYSSLPRYIAEGVYPADWACEPFTIRRQE